MTTESISFTQNVHGETAHEGERKTKIAVTGTQSLASTLWLAGWLFTIGFGRLVWWKILLGIIVWPYFLGTLIR